MDLASSILEIRCLVFWSCKVWFVSAVTQLASSAAFALGIRV